ncbi:hypothetical protein KIK84_04615 [Curvibacter sp. CHRR-16]|uniref:hypothetical protein n=1 Tax=Curvibacter sp. CHRR-16 TaxID=2835872 RepID=UPI001BDB64CB|nr:hypothetical protein [Curvibacter sp. CHRR-16]MBT0569595.1 hypothetical protein [Curvibacter sp. CHRR-16]
MQRLAFATVLIAASAYCTGVSAQNSPSIYRCGNQYSQQPCQDLGEPGKTGQAATQQVVPTPDPLPPSGKPAKTKSYAEQAQALERERQAREAQAARQAQREPAEFKARSNAQHDKNAPGAASGKKSHKKKKQDPDYFTAGTPKPAKKP